MVQRTPFVGLLALGLVLFLDPSGAAGQKQNPQQKAAQQQQKALQKAAQQQQKANQTQVHATLIGELHEIHARLANADGDYNGHKASAMRRVHAAQHALHQEMAHHNKKAAEMVQAAIKQQAAANPLPKGNKNAPPLMPLTQAVSDAQLKKAIVDLTAVHTQMQTLARGPHHGLVLDEINAAVQQLHAALKVSAHRQQQAVQTQVHATLIGELHEIHARLANADHDYNGHRVRAMGHVQAAKHALHQEMAHHNNNAAKLIQAAVKQQAAANPLPQGNKAAREPLPQAVSDAQLKKAATDLTTVHAQVQKLARGPHHGQVLDEINAAIQQLTIALKIR